MLLKGRKALVTGGSSGIGKATAQRLARDGASVAVNYYSEHERAEAEQVAGFALLRSKGGMKLLTQTAARELADKRIRVVSVAPGGSRRRSTASCSTTPKRNRLSRKK